MDAVDDEARRQRAHGKMCLKGGVERFCMVHCEIFFFSCICTVGKRVSAFRDFVVHASASASTCTHASHPRRSTVRSCYTMLCRCSARKPRQTHVENKRPHSRIKECVPCMGKQRKTERQAHVSKS